MENEMNEEAGMETANSCNYIARCRLCLMENFENLKAIFDDEIDGQPVVEKIFDFLGIEVSIDDKLSTMICLICIDKLNSWYDFKMTCCENQAKLQEWLEEDLGYGNDRSISNGGDSIMEMKEAMDHSDNESDFLIKTEPIDEDDEIYDVPPSLTPHPPELNTFEDIPNGTNDTSGIDVDTNKYDVQSRTCTICNKIFSTPGNRRKHEKSIHRLNKSFFQNISISGVTADEDSRQSGVVSANSSIQDEKTSVEIQRKTPEIEMENTNTKLEYTETDIQKIQFAAGLRLKQRNSTPNEISTLLGDTPLTKVEESYIIKCQKMVTMFSTLICSCHGYQHKTAKRLFAHLRSSSSWFPVYTCYNCVITHVDRSSNMRHTARCPKKHLENLIKLSEMRKMIDFRIRLYQFYKCVKCTYVFAFHDDFCDHVDTDHAPDDLPVTCTCGKEYHNPNEYKEHIYKNCMVNFYCDVCFDVSTSLDDFKKHCEDVHDPQDGFVFLPNVTGTDLKMDYENESFHSFSQDEGETIECAPDLTFDDDDPNSDKILNSDAIKNWFSKTSCPLCSKVYSNYHNMLRHYKTHDDTERNIPCPSCDDKFRLKTELKEHLIISHGMVENKSVKNNSSLPCPECGIVFTNFEEWSRHKEIHGLPFTCGECGKQLTTQEELDQHRSVHLNIKVFRDSKTHAYRSTMLSPQNDYNELEITEVDNRDDNQDSSKKYSCETCNKTYSGYGGLWEHNKRYHPDRQPSKDYPRQCKYCDKVLMSGGAYYMHKQMHERYAQAPVVKEEIDSGEESSSYTCRICYKVFSNKSNLKSHMKNHLDAGANRSLLKTGRLKTYWCNICHQACSGFDELQKHKKEHINENMSDNTEQMEQDHVCDICKKEFTNKVTLKKHKEKHIDDKEEDTPNKKYYLYCKYCRIPFLDIAVMNTHIETEHKNETPKSRQKSKNKFTCNLCRKSFETSGALCSHQGWHKRAKYVNKMVYKTKARLAQAQQQQQLQQQQATTSKYRCQTCHETFTNDTSLQIHILEIHRNINATLISPRCTPCQKDFESQSSYEKHMELHKIVEKQSQQKSYTCKFCTSSFIRTDMLNAHIMTHHRELLNSRPSHIYKCTHCDRTFDKQTALTIHMKVHNNNKQKPEKFMYTCSICHTGYNVAKDLRQHILQAHPF